MIISGILRAEIATVSSAFPSSEPREHSIACLTSDSLNDSPVRVREYSLSARRGNLE